MTSLPTVPGRTIGSPNFGVRTAILLGTALAIAPAPALAEMHVGGTPDAVRIEARDAPVEEVLAALDRAFGMHYQLSVNVNKRLSGTYVGSLPRVLTRILDGYNFILKTDNGKIAVTVVGTPYAPGTSPTPPASPSAQVVQQPVQPARVGNDLARTTASGPSVAPSPATEPADGPASLPAPGAAPAPVPQLRQSRATAPMPSVAGSAPTPVLEPEQSAGTPPSPARPTPLSVPQQGE